MKASELVKNHETAFGFVALVPFFLAGLWAMWQAQLVGASGGYSQTKLQPVGIAFKGSTRYLSQASANTYQLSQSLFYDAFGYLIFVAFIWVVVLPWLGRSKA